MNRVRWSETAADDMQRIAEHIRQYNPALEQKIIGVIVDRAHVLAQFPQLGRRYETDGSGTELRSLVVGKRYRLLYEFRPDHAVEILQVVDVRSDYDAWQL